MNHPQPDTCFDDYSPAEEAADHKRRVQQAENEADNQSLEFMSWLTDEAAEPHAMAVLKSALALWACGGIYSTGHDKDEARATLSAVVHATRNRWIEARTEQLEIA